MYNNGVVEINNRFWWVARVGSKEGLATRPVFLEPGAFCNANERSGLQNYVSG